jgi:hypothetical protein
MSERRDLRGPGAPGLSCCRGHEEDMKDMKEGMWLDKKSTCTRDERHAPRKKGEKERERGSERE